MKRSMMTKIASFRVILISTHRQVPGARGHETEVVLCHIEHGEDVRLSIEGRGEAGPA